MGEHDKDQLDRVRMVQALFEEALSEAIRKPLTWEYKEMLRSLVMIKLLYGDLHDINCTHKRLAVDLMKSSLEQEKVSSSPMDP